MTYRDEEYKTGVESIEDITVLDDPKTQRLPNILSGKYAINTNQAIIQSIKTEGDDIVNIMKIFNGFFPKNTTLQRIEASRANVEHYKNNPRYVTLLKPGDYNYGDQKYKINQ